MQGMIVTHNHPYKEEQNGNKNLTQISTKDLQLAYKCRMYELRLVNGLYVHSFSWSADANENHVQLLCESIKTLVAEIKTNMYKAKNRGLVIHAHQEGTHKIINLMKNSEQKFKYNYTLRRRKIWKNQED